MILFPFGYKYNGDWLTFFSSSSKLILLKYSLFLRIIKLMVFLPFCYKYNDDWLIFFSSSSSSKLILLKYSPFFANNASWKESNSLLSILLQIQNGDWPTSFFFSSPKLILPKYSFIRKWYTPKEIKRFSFVSLKCSKHVCHDSRRERFLFSPPHFHGTTADKSPAQENHSFANISYPRSPFLKFTTPQRVSVTHKFRAKPTRSARKLSSWSIFVAPSIYPFISV